MRREAEFFSFGAFDSEIQIWLIEELLNSKISRPRDGSHFLKQRVCIEPVSRQVVSDDLNVDGSWQAKIQNLADHVGGQKRECNARELLWKRQTKLVNVVVRGMVLGGQGHKNVGIRCANRSRITVGEIDAAVGQANVVNDALDFVRWNLPSNRLLDQIAQVGRFFNAHSGGSTQMKFESTAVNAGEEVAAQPRNQNRQGAETEGKERDQESAPVMERELQQAAIAPTKVFEGLFKTFLKAHQRIAASGMSSLLFSPRNKYLAIVGTMVRESK